MKSRILAGACLALLTGSGLLAEDTEQRYRGRPLAVVLQELTSQGLKVVFSSRVVRPEMRVRTEPTALTPRKILAELLFPHGLRAVEGPGGTLLVVQAPAGPPSKKATQPSPPTTGVLELDLRRLDDHRALRANRVVVKGLVGEASISKSGSVMIPAVPPGIYNLEVSVPGFAGPSLQTFSVEAGDVVGLVLDLTELPGGPDLEMTPLPLLTLVFTEGARFKETVEVSATSDRVNAGPTAMSVQPEKVIGMAGAGDNVYRTLQTFPGVETLNELDSRIAVRGGSPDQNLTVWNGVEIFSPHHQLGYSSAFVPETVKSFELSAGGFDARYGDRLSSLLVVENRRGSTAHSLRGSAAMSVVDADVVIEGKLPRLRNGSWLLSGRTSLYDVVGGKLLNYLPSLADLQAGVYWEPRPGQRLSLFGIFGKESGSYSEKGLLLDHYTVRVRGKNALVSVNFESDLGSGASLRTIASFYRSVRGGGVKGTLTSDARAANGSRYYDSAQVNVAFNREIEGSDWSIRQELTTQLSKRHLIESGLELHRLQTRWGLLVEGDRSAGHANEAKVSVYGLPSDSLPSFLDSNRSYSRWGMWIQDRIRTFSRIVPLLGLRLDHSGINGETTASPRASFSLRLNEATRLRVATGVYLQSPGYEKLLESDYFVDMSEGERFELQSERSLHNVLAVEHDFTPAVSARIEAYHKSFSNLIVGRLETEEERRARLAVYDFDRFYDDVPSEPQITVFPSNEARGTAYGVEFHIVKNAASEDTRLTGWASYTYGLAQREAYGHTFPFDYDRRHSFSLVGCYRLSPTIAISGTARVASGLPWTPPVGVRLAAEEDISDRDGDRSFDELVPVRDHKGQLIYTFDLGGRSNINSARLPVFARLDARFTYQPGGPAGRWSFFVEAINVLNRRNAGLIRCSLGYNPNGERPLIYQVRDFSVPFLPSFGMRVRF